MTTPHLPSTPLATTTEDYSESYYRSGLGPPYEQSEPHWARFFGAVAAQLLQHVQISTALDVGCAKGFFVEALLRRGVDAYGVDISEYAIAAASDVVRERVSVHDLTAPLAGKWDLISCIEVIEHMDPVDAQKAIDHITAATDLVLLSSTPHDFAEPTHVNVHRPQDWAEWFAARGFFRRLNTDLSGLSPWATLFERRNLTAPAVVSLYEAELAPLREEVVVKRQAELEAHRRLEQALAETAAPAKVPTERSFEEIASLDRLLTLTDQLIGLESELAESRYQHDLLALVVSSSPTSPPSSYETEGRSSDLVLRARLTAEIELRQALARTLAEERARADAAERELARLRSSQAWKAAHTVSSVAGVIRSLRK
jgi:SAM-dependent methyltransferase